MDATYDEVGIEIRTMIGVVWVYDCYMMDDVLNWPMCNGRLWIVVECYSYCY